jgi:glycosyltransferase involved in cell wall biosynthesis/phosphorylcholine metabolism protein LicD
VAAYNVAPYIDKCLQSLQAQSLEGIQIIVVDDGSTDDTSERIRAFQRNAGATIEVIRQANGGLSAARNTGIAAARGRYIGFVDGDDWVSPRMFEKLYCKALETGSEVVVCAGLKRWPDGKCRRIRLRIATDQFGTSVGNNPEILWGGHSYAWNKIYARDLIERESFRFPEGKLFEDSAVVYGLVAKARRVDAVNEALYQYRMGRDGAITRVADPRIFDIFDSCESIRELRTQLHDTPGISDITERLTRTHLFARLPALHASKSPLLSLAFTRKALGYLDRHYPGWRNRYDRGDQTWLRYYTRRGRMMALLVSFLSPLWNRVRSGVQRRINGARRVAIYGLAARKLHRAFRAEGIPYTLDFESLRAVHEGRRLGTPLEVAILPNAHAVTDVAVALRQRGMELVRSYMHEERCIAQEWRLRRPLLGLARVELRFLEAAPDGTVLTRFFRAIKSPVPSNEGVVVQLRTAAPARFGERPVAMAGAIRVVDSADPFTVSRTRPALRPPRDILRLAARLPDMEILQGPGYFHYGMPPDPPATVQRARDEQLDTLKRVLEFCAERSLHPLLADGSLLGAVRHQGYIPWDDDIDLWMLRNEFEELVASELPEGLAILHYTTNDRFHLGFAKIVRLESAFEWSYPRGLEPAGTSIDVFPLDWSASPERFGERIRAMLVRFLRQVIRAKYRFPEARRRRTRQVVSWLLPGVLWHRVLRALVVAPPLGKRTNLTSWFSAYPASRASYPAAWILPPGELSFEGVPVPAPRDPARVLTRTYGDFMELPGPAKRTSRNHFLKLRAGEERGLQPARASRARVALP